MMSVLTSHILLLFVLVQRNVVADIDTNAVKPKSEEDKCSATIIKQLAETTDLVCEVNSKLNKTDTDLEQLKKDLRHTRYSADVVRTHLEIYLSQELKKQKALLKIKEHLPNPIKETNCVGQGPRDCSDVRAMGFTVSGVYHIYPGSDQKRIQADTYCEFNSFNESWLVFQRRRDGSENFERYYTQYEQGFGNLTGEFWLGNEVLHLLTANRKYKLRIELEDFDGEKRFAEYSTFFVNSSNDAYRLTVGGYFGNAGDSMAFQNNSKFSTLDLDNDGWVGNCVKKYRGAWWHSSCHHSNLNGLYFGGPHKSFGDGMDWLAWRGLHYSLKKTEMKLVPLEEKRSC